MSLVRAVRTGLCGTELSTGCPGRLVLQPVRSAGTLCTLSSELCPPHVHGGPNANGVADNVGTTANLCAASLLGPMLALLPNVLRISHELCQATLLRAGHQLCPAQLFGAGQLCDTELPLRFLSSQFLRCPRDADTNESTVGVAGSRGTTVARQSWLGSIHALSDDIHSKSKGGTSTARWVIGRRRKLKSAAIVAAQSSGL
jgi:hypothetical protein